MDSQRSFVAPDFQSSSCVTGHTSGFSYCLGFLKNGVSSFFFLRSHYTLHQDSQSIWLRGFWEPPSCWEITQTETENMCQTETVEVIFVIFHRFKYISVSIRIYIHILFLFLYTHKKEQKRWVIMTPWLMHSAEFDRFNAFCVCPLNLCIFKSDVQRKAQSKLKKLNSSIKISLSKPKSEAHVFHWTAMIRDITPTNVAVAFFGWLK